MLDLSMVHEPGLRLEDMPQRRLNFMDLQSSIELFTPMYQALLTDNDFWRATNSLQLDETIGLYVATLLDAREHLILLNNSHPLVPMSTLRAGFRLTLHGLSTEMLHAFLMRLQASQRPRVVLRHSRNPLRGMARLEKEPPMAVPAWCEVWPEAADHPDAYRDARPNWTG